MRLSILFEPDASYQPMFTTATNFLARHAFVVMPKARRKAEPAADAVHATRCRMARCCAMAACSSSSSAAPPPRCGCCSTTTSHDREPSQASSSSSPRPTAGATSGASSFPASRPASFTTSRPTARSSPAQGQRFDPQARLIDPYARALAGELLPANDGIIRPPKCVVVDDTLRLARRPPPPKRPLSETIIYEMHVRGFTRSPSSGVEHPGTYLGVIEKIPYLKSLGVTAVELMPVHEFPIERVPTARSRDRTELLGLRPDGLLLAAPRLRGRQRAGRPGAASSRRWSASCTRPASKSSSTSSSTTRPKATSTGPTFSFKGLENRVYYMLNDGGTYKNFSGCGNTVNGNHPIVREMIFHCLRHWVHNYHIDGFRFDLASILSRNRNGELVPNPPLVELIAEDPLLADTKIIAEAWDAAGAYQVGSFANLRWAEWNGHYRDDVRRFWRGDCGHDRPAGHAAGRLQRPLPAERPPAVPQHQLHHVARRLHAQRPGELRATSTTRPTAKTTATATTTTTAATTASKARRAARRSTTPRSGRSRT